MTGQYRTALIIVTHAMEIIPACQRIHPIRDGRAREEAGEDRAIAD